MRRKAVVRDLIILTAFVAVTGIALVQIPRIQVDGSIEAFLPSDHAIVEVNKEIEETFTSLDSMIVAVGVTFGTVLEPGMLALVTEMTGEIEAVDSVDSVVSLTNVDYVQYERDQMVVVPLVESVDAEGAAEARRRIAEWPQAYLGTIVSNDLKTAGLVVTPLSKASDEELSAIYARLADLASSNESANVRVHVAGAPVYEQEISRNVAWDVRFLVPAAAALIILILGIAFRRVLGVLFPMLSVLIAGVWVVGAIGALGITLTMATLLVPVLLLVVGSAYGIHVMQHFYEDLAREEGFVPGARIAEIVRCGVSAIRRPIVPAGVTTAAGFLAQLSSPLGPFRVFGALSALGIGAALLSSLVLIPALLRLRYRNGMEAATFAARRAPRPARSSAAQQPSRLDAEQRRFPAVLEGIVNHHRLFIATLSAALVLTTVVLVPRIRVGTNMANFFRASSRVATDAGAINSQLGGTGLISVEITAPERGDILRTDFLADLEAFETYLTGRHPEVTGVRSIVPSLKRINSILNYDTVPYRAVEKEEASFDLFADDGLFGDASAEQTAAAGVDESSAEPTGPSPGGRDGRAGAPPAAIDPDAVLTYADVAAMLHGALVEAGTDADARAVVARFLSAGNYHGASFEEIPRDPAKYGLATEEELTELIAQYLVLYSGNLDMFINDALEPDRTLVSVQINDEERSLLLALRDEITRFWEHHLPEGWQFVIGGPSTLTLVLSELVTRSQYLSLAGALAIVFVIVVITFRSLVAGLLGMIPVAFALMGIFISMAVFGFYLDVVTSVLAALAIGIGVDYGIHLMSAYRRELTAGHPNPLRAVYRTTGSAILFNAASVAIGFLSLLFSLFVPIRQVGILFSVSMVLAGAASLVVLPPAIEYFSPRFISRGISVRQEESVQEAPAQEGSQVKEAQ